MRLLCRDNHDERDMDDTPTCNGHVIHDFQAAWGGESQGVIFCTACGDVRPLEVPKIEAPVEERIERRNR